MSRKVYPTWCWPDDNFTTICSAVEEGRKVYSNIRKAIQFLLSANLGEVLTLFIATMVGWRILEPIHILWINLVTDTLPALALGLEKAGEDVMTKKPRKSSSSIFSGGVGAGIVYQGIIEAALTLLVYYWAHTHYDEGVAVTMVLPPLVCFKLHMPLTSDPIRNLCSRSACSATNICWAHR